MKVVNAVLTTVEVFEARADLFNYWDGTEVILTMVPIDDWVLLIFEGGV